MTQKNKDAKNFEFYSDVLDNAKKSEFERAAGIKNIDGEIALLRLKIRGSLENDPENLNFIGKDIELLAKLLKIRHYITPQDEDSLGQAIQNVWRDIVLPMGADKFVREKMLKENQNPP